MKLGRLSFDFGDNLAILLLLALIVGSCMASELMQHDKDMGCVEAGACEYVSDGCGEVVVMRKPEDGKRKGEKR